MRIDTPVVVVGAGLAGLMTAYELAESGIGSTVLESSGRPGGRIETMTFADGMTAEAGMEEFWQGGPAYSLFERLSLPMVEDRAQSSVVLDGRLFTKRGEGDRDSYLAGIFSPDERSDFLAWDRLTGRLLTQLTESPTAAAQMPAALRRTSMSEFVSSIVPSPRVREWIRLVVEAEIAVEWDRICALDGVAELRPFHDTPTGWGERNGRLVGGNQKVISALIDRLPPDSVQLDSPVIAVRDAGTHVEVDHLDPCSRPTTTTCWHAVLTIPSWSLRGVKLDLPTLDSAERRLLATSLTTATAGSYVKVTLRLRPDASRLWSDRGPGLFTLLSDAAAGCLYLRSAAGEGRGTGDHLLTMLIHGAHARRMSGLPVQEMVRRSVRHLERLKVTDGHRRRPVALLGGITEMVNEGFAFDHPKAVAYWPVDRQRSRFDEMAERLRAPHGRVHIGGDTTQSSHSDGALTSAARMVESVSTALAGRS